MIILTWKQFKEEVERQGVKDEMEIAYIDTTGYGFPKVEIDKDTNEVIIL